MDKNKVQVLEGQSLLDIAIQTAGSVEAVIEIATLNGMSVSDDIVPSQIRTVDVHNRSVASYYTARAITPATAVAMTVCDSWQIFEDIFQDTFQ